MNRKRAILLIITGALVFAGCFFLWHKANTHDVASEIFASRQNFDSFMAASEATAQRVHYQGESKGNEGVLQEYGYTHEPLVPVTGEQREELKRLLALKSSYLWDLGKMCMPRYAMLVHFRSANRVITVAFCFECKELLVLDSRLPVKALNTTDGFDPISGQLVAIAKSIYPNDAEIQTLK